MLTVTFLAFQLLKLIILKCVEVRVCSTQLYTLRTIKPFSMEDRFRGPIAYVRRLAFQAASKDCKASKDVGVFAILRSTIWKNSDCFASFVHFSADPAETIRRRSTTMRERLQVRGKIIEWLKRGERGNHPRPRTSPEAAVDRNNLLGRLGRLIVH